MDEHTYHWTKPVMLKEALETLLLTFSGTTGSVNHTQPDYSTGIEALDTLLGGLYNGDLILIHEESGEDWNYLGLQLSRNVSLATGKSVLFFTDDTQLDIAARLTAMEGNFFYDQLKYGIFTTKEWEALGTVFQALSTLPILLDGGARYTEQQILERCTSVENLGLIVVDQPFLWEYHEITSEIRSEFFQNLAKKLNVPVVLFDNHYTGRDLFLDPYADVQLALTCAYGICRVVKNSHGPTGHCDCVWMDTGIVMGETWVKFSVINDDKNQLNPAKSCQLRKTVVPYW